MKALTIVSLRAPIHRVSQPVAKNVARPPTKRRPCAWPLSARSRLRVELLLNHYVRRLRNHSRLGHSSRNLPLKLSSVPLPGFARIDVRGVNPGIDQPFENLRG